MEYSIIDAVRELFVWQASEGTVTNFNAKLYEILGKAEPDDRARLATAFPLEFIAWDMWRHSDDPKEFFRAWLGKDFTLE